jgi:hypothetical protein
MKKKKKIVEKDGHRWIETPIGELSRCIFCGMRYDYYLDMKLKCGKNGRKIR